MNPYLIGLLGVGVLIVFAMRGGHLQWFGVGEIHVNPPGHTN